MISHIEQTAATIAELLTARRADSVDHDLLVADERRLTYGQLDKRSADLARQMLDGGVAFGTRVGIMLPNSPEFVVTWTAVTRIGAVAVPISTLSTPFELRRICRHANIHLLVSTPTFRHHSFAERIADAMDDDLEGRRPPFRSTSLPMLRSVWMWGDNPPEWSNAIDLDLDPGVRHDLLVAVESEVTAADAVSIIYTSGSTAEPKGVVHTHGSFLRAARKCRDSYDVRRGDRLFTQMPFFWVGGLTVNLLAVMSAGATQLTCDSSIAAEVLAFLERERPTHVMAWPHLARAIAADPTFSDRDLSSVRTGGLYEALPESLRPRDPSLLSSALGMTETAGPHTVVCLHELAEQRRGSFGPPQPGMEHRVVDPDTGSLVADGEIGELEVRGDTLMVGLVRRERHETFDPDGWYRTGDLVSHRDGDYHFHGRLDDLIKTGGANVSPREVEEALLGVTGVVSATVSSVTDEARGQVVGAAVGCSDANLSADIVRTAVARQLSAYKVPRVIMIVAQSQLPMMSSGKVDRVALLQALRRHASQQLGSPNPVRN